MGGSFQREFVWKNQERPKPARVVLCALHNLPMAHTRTDSTKISSLEPQSVIFSTVAVKTDRIFVFCPHTYPLIVGLSFQRLVRKITIFTCLQLWNSKELYHKITEVSSNPKPCQNLLLFLAHHKLFNSQPSEIITGSSLNLILNKPMLNSGKIIDMI